MENKIFQENREFLDYISEKTVILSKYGGFLLDKQFSKAEEAFENCQDIKHATQISCFKSTHFH
jgi:hypothetical protein